MSVTDLSTVQDTRHTTRNPFLQMMEQIGNSNPKLRMMAEFMQQYTDNKENVDAPNGIQPQNSNSAFEHLQKQNIDLIVENENLKEKVDWATERDQVLAFAVGACPDCWGDDAGCRSCSGKGIPGHFMPDQDAFNEFILPAVQIVYDRLYRGKIESTGTDTHQKKPVPQATQFEDGGDRHAKL